MAGANRPDTVSQPSRAPAASTIAAAKPVPVRMELPPDESGERAGVCRLWPGKGVVESGSVAAEALPHLLDGLIDAETGRPLPGREVLERFQELFGAGQDAVEDAGVRNVPVVVRVAGDVGALVRVGP